MTNSTLLHYGQQPGYGVPVPNYSYQGFPPTAYNMGASLNEQSRHPHTRVEHEEPGNTISSPKVHRRKRKRIINSSSELSEARSISPPNKMKPVVKPHGKTTRVTPPREENRNVATISGTTQVPNTR